jgi:galactoside O-acetyltransferase
VVADFVGISGRARILTGTDDFLGGALIGPTIPDEFRRGERGRVVLEAHGVIGANAVILPNLTIGEGAAIGAGSIVTKSLAPWTVYAGMPARPLKPRPKDTVRRYEQLLFAKYGYPERPVRPLLPRPSLPRFIRPTIPPPAAWLPFLDAAYEQKGP